MAQRTLSPNYSHIPAYRLRYRNLGIGPDLADPELLGGFFLLAGKKALQEFGAFLFIALNAKPQEDFTGLRNTPSLLLRHILEFLL
jgi:hypothetical protein